MEMISSKEISRVEMCSVPCSNLTHLRRSRSAPLAHSNPWIVMFPASSIDTSMCSYYEQWQCPSPAPILQDCPSTLQDLNCKQVLRICLLNSSIMHMH